MARPRLPVGAHGTVKLEQIEKGKWRARTLHRFTDGKVRQVERFGRTRAQAENRLKEALTSIEVPTHGAAMTKGMTIAKLADAFLESKRSAQLSPNSIRNYEIYASTQVVPKLGKLLVSEVKSMRVQEFMDGVLAESGSGAAHSTKAVLSGMFNLAIRNDLIAVNPVGGTERIKHKPKGAGRGAKAISPKEVLEMIEAVRADAKLVEYDFADLWEFMSLTGCRIGEATGLVIARTSFDDCTVTLGPSVAKIKRGAPFIYEDAKTKASERTIQVPRRALDIVASRAGRFDLTDEGAVFPDPLGMLYEPNKLGALWRTRRDDLGFPTFTSHGFRKSVATMLDAAGLSARDIADYLGHSRPSMTQDVYMARQTNSSKAAEVVASKFGVNSGSAPL